MKYSCEIIKDLIPLYTDEVCSAESRSAVEAHFAECPSCRGLYEKMKSDDITPVLESDAAEAVAYHEKRVRRRGFIVGAVIAAIFMIPILVCLIVDLASGSGLSWFFIVLASLLLAASVIIVPLMVPKHKLLISLTASAASLIILLGVIALYSGSDWFFMVASCVLFGSALVFLPIVVNCEPIKTALRGRKSLAVFFCDTVLFCIMAVCIGLYVEHPGYGATMAAISAPFISLAWALMLIIRYVRSGAAKTGICLIISGAFIFSVNNAVNSLLGYDIPWPVLRPFDWSYAAIDGNVKWVCLIACLAVGGILIVINAFSKGRKK